MRSAALAVMGAAAARAGCGRDWQLVDENAAPGDVMTRVDLKGAKCIDGSPAVYYIARNTSSTKYVVWLEGGGVCQTLKDCKSRANGALGSSKGYKSTQTAARGQLMSDPTTNPDFATWNRVFLPYCTGDVFSGTLTEPINPWSDPRIPGGGDPADPWKGYFSGHNHVAEALGDLQAQQGADTATDVILTGCSAGGIGTFLNCDYMGEQFPKAKTACRPEGGYFGLPIASYKDWKAGKTSADMHHANDTAWMYAVKGYPQQTPAYAECMAKTNKGKDLPFCNQIPDAPDGTTQAAGCCQNAPYLYPYMKTPVFISQNTMDVYQVSVQGGGLPTATKYIQYVQGVIAGSLTDSVVRGPKKDTDGMFATGCLQHCPMPWSGKGAPTIDSMNDMEAFGDWYFGRSRGPKIHLDNSTDPVHYLSCAMKTDF